MKLFLIGIFSNVCKPLPVSDMVRNYKKKGTYANYKPEVIDAIVAAVKTNLMTLRGASEEFGIPPTTLHN